jgi:hypothetical protein
VVTSSEQQTEGPSDVTSLLDQLSSSNGGSDSFKSARQVSTPMLYAHIDALRHRIRRDNPHPASNDIARRPIPTARQPEKNGVHRSQAPGPRRRRWSLRSSFDRFRLGHHSSQPHEQPHRDAFASTENLLLDAEEATPPSSVELARPQRISVDVPATSIIGPFESGR